MDRALRMLLAEDNPGDVFLVKESLNRHSLKHNLTVASDGERALKLIEAAENSPSEAFDIFVLDLNLPLRPGLELLARIRKCDGPLNNALIVVVTSSYSIGDRNAASALGADYYFCKPANLDAFLQLGSIIQQLWSAKVSREKGRKLTRKGKAAQ